MIVCDWCVGELMLFVFVLVFVVVVLMSVGFFVDWLC